MTDQNAAPATELWVERTGTRLYTGRSSRGAEVRIGSEASSAWTQNKARATAPGPKPTARRVFAEHRYKYMAPPRNKQVGETGWGGD